MQEKIIFVFPGQGSQYVGMAKDLFKEFAIVRYIFEKVSDISHKNMSKICFEGPNEILVKPENTSLAIFAHSVATAKIIESEFGLPLFKMTDFVAGYSLGQYSALHCAGSLNIETVVAGLSNPEAYVPEEVGGMICVIGLLKEQLEEILNSSKKYGYAAISNHNSRDQFVISGNYKALDFILDLAKKSGARLANKLNVSIPVHCELMSGAAKKLNCLLDSFCIDMPKIQCFSNQSANIINDNIDVKKALVGQMTNGVRWYDIMQKFPEYNITNAYEIGPGKALSGLIRRAKVGCRASGTDSVKSIKELIESLNNKMLKSH